MIAISIWEKETFFAPQDIIIVGSGFVGLWSAWYLKNKHPEYRISVIDRGVIPIGASTRNAGFACFGSVSELMNDAVVMGTDAVLELVEMRYKGLERIQKIFKKREIDFSLCGGYELYDLKDSKTQNELEDDIAYLNLLLKPVTGTKKTYQLADDKITSFGFGNTKHLIKNNHEGCLHSGKLLQSLLRMVQAAGVQVMNGIQIKRFESEKDCIQLITDQHFHFKTQQLLICTSAFAKDLLPDEDIIPARGQVVVSSPIDNLPFSGTFHSEMGFYYFRNLGNRVLLGGARNKAFYDEQTTSLTTSHFIQNELERYLNEVVLPHYQNQYTIQYRWAGIMDMGSKKMPIVKEVQPHIFCAVRMSGMGVALAPVIGQQIAKMM